MDKWITLTEYNWAFWVAGMFALFEFFRWAYGGVEWLCRTFGVETKGMREKREWEDRLKNAENAIVEIKNTSKKNVDMFIDHERQVVEQFVGIRDELVSELNRLHDKIDEQAEDNRETDKAILRGNINSSMRYFEMKKDEQGRVHISLADYETLNGLFEKYFAKKGNGAFEQAYKDFKTFIIDR